MPRLNQQSLFVAVHAVPCVSRCCARLLFLQLCFIYFLSADAFGLGLLCAAGALDFTNS